MNKGFTLIELLVVVLIIGILAAIAVPQYEKAVVKARAAEMLVWVRRYWDAQQVYKMANGSFASCLNDLDLDYASAFPQELESSSGCVTKAGTGQSGWKDIQLIGGGISPRGVVWGPSSPYPGHGFGFFPWEPAQEQWGALIKLCAPATSNEAGWRQIVKSMGYTRVVQGNAWCYAQYNLE